MHWRWRGRQRDEPLIAAALAVLALACAFEGALDDATRFRSEAAALVDAMPDDKLALRLDAVAYLAGAELYMDLFPESAAHGRRGLAIARATGQGFLLPMLTQASASTIGIQGGLLEASELLDGAIEASRLAGNDQTLAWDLMNRAFVDVHRGEMVAAIAAAEESLELTHGLGHGFVSTHAGVMLAIARMENGEPETAVELFVTAGGGEAMPLLPGGWRAKYLELLTRGWLMLGKQRRSGARGGLRGGGRRDDRPGHGFCVGAARRGGSRARDRRRRERLPRRRCNSAASCDTGRRHCRSCHLSHSRRALRWLNRESASEPSRSSSAQLRHSTDHDATALPPRGRA